MRSGWRQHLRWLLTIVVLTGTIAPRLALCIGADGHTAIEPFGADCCSPLHSEHSGVSSSCVPGCSDSPLRLWATRNPGHDHSLFVACDVGPLRGADVALALVGAVTRGAVRVDPAGILRHRRLTVLRC